MFCHQRSQPPYFLTMPIQVRVIFVWRTPSHLELCQSESSRNPTNPNGCWPSVSKAQLQCYHHDCCICDLVGASCFNLLDAPRSPCTYSGFIDLAKKKYPLWNNRRRWKENVCFLRWRHNHKQPSHVQVPCSLLLIVWDNIAIPTRPGSKCASINFFFVNFHEVSVYY